MITRESIRGVFPILPLVEVADFLDSRRKPVKESERKAGQYPYYGANGQQGTIDGFIFEEPLILLAEDGGFFDQLDRGIAYRIEGKTWVNNHAHVIRPRAGVNLAFLCRVLENYDVSPYISGSTRAKLTKGQAEKIEIPLPSLEEQKRIAVILDQADALRRKRQRALDRLNQLGQAIFLEMFGARIANGDHSEFHDLASLMSIPLHNGAYFPKEQYSTDGVEMVHMSDAFHGIVERGNLKRVSCTFADIEKYGLNSSDILIARRSLNLSGAAKPCLIPQFSEPLIFESSFIRLRPAVERIVTRYLYAYLSNPFVRSAFIDQYITQSTISGINQTNLAKIKVFCPPLMEQREFSSRIESVEALADRQRGHATCLDTLFAALQHRAFRGELTSSSLKEAAV